jgi:hypothetical protein
LFGIVVSGGEQEGEPTALATEAGKPELLLRVAARESSAGVARETPQIWARMRESRLSADPLQEMIMGQAVDGNKESGGSALQEMIGLETRESIEEIGL